MQTGRQFKYSYKYNCYRCDAEIERSIKFNKSIHLKCHNCRLLEMKENATLSNKERNEARKSIHKRN